MTALTFNFLLASLQHKKSSVIAGLRPRSTQPNRCEYKWVMHGQSGPDHGFFPVLF